MSQPPGADDNRESSEAPKKRRRKRGTGFPVVSLPEAAAIVTEAGKHGLEHTMQAFAEYMGHQTTNSGTFRQRFASLRDWDLVTGTGDAIHLSDLGRELAYEIDQDTRRAVLRRAFMRCTVFAVVYDEAAKNTAIDASKIGSRAVLSHGVAPESRGAFVRSFIDSAIAAGLAEPLDDVHIRFLSLNESDEPADGPESARSTISSRDLHPSPTRAAAAPVVLRNPWPITDGEIVLEVRSTRPLPAKAFGAMAEVVERLETLALLLREERVEVHGGTHPADDDSDDE